MTRSPRVASAIAARCAFVGGARIDHRDLAGADDIGVGAEKGVRARIVGDDAPDVGRDLLGHAVVDVHATIESKLRRHGLEVLLVFW